MNPAGLLRSDEPSDQIPNQPARGSAQRETQLAVLDCHGYG